MTDNKIKEFISKLQEMAAELETDAQPAEQTVEPAEQDATEQPSAEAGIMTASSASGLDPFGDEVKYKSFPIFNGATVNFNLSENSTITEINDVEGLLGLKISHISNGENVNYGYGVGFTLNLNEKLLSSSSSIITASSKNLVYYDSFGDEYTVKNGVAKALILTSVPSNISGVCTYLSKGKTGIELLIRKPVLCLTDGDITRSFNAYGHLIMISDNYRHYIFIEHDTQNMNKIIKVSNYKNSINSTGANLIEAYDFVYDTTTGYLQNIRKDSINLVTYTYSGQYLIGMTYYGDVKVTLAYAYWSVMNITSSDDYKCEIGGSVSPYLTVWSYKNKIPNGTTAYTEIANWTISGIATAKVKITDIDGNSEYFTFDGSTLTGYYAEQHGVVTCAEKYSTGGTNDAPIRTITKSDESKLYATPYSSFSFVAGEKVDISYNRNKQITTVERDNMPLTATSKGNFMTLYTYDNTTYLCTKIFSSLVDSSNKSLYSYTEEYAYDADKRLIKKTVYDKYSDTKGKTVEEYTYDEYSCVCKTQTYNTKAPTMLFVDEKTYNSTGLLKSQKDATGQYSTGYYYDSFNRLSSSVTSTNYWYGYTYDARSELTGLQFGKIGYKVTNTVGYTSGEVTSLTCGDISIGFEYESKRRVSKVTVNGSEHETIAYTDGTDTKTVTVTNANGESFKTEQTNSGLNYSGYYNNDKLYTVKYNAAGDISSFADSVTGRTLSYSYDSHRALKTFTEGTYKETYIYDSLGRISKQSSTINSATRQDTYTYRDDDVQQIKGYTTGVFKVVPSYDIYGRYAGKSVYIGANCVDKEEVEYSIVGTNLVNRPSNITYNAKTKVTQSYTYDEVGNISTNGFGYYQYDETGRLKSEMNFAIGTYNYTYDTNGNITRKQHASNSGNKNYTYVYSNGRLKSFNGESCVYDSAGNPTTYRGKTAAWKGRQLISYNGNTFAYDGKGRRYKKNGIEYSYDSQDRLISTSDGLEFFYDFTGLLGFKYSNNYYYYRKNAQGDIIAILDKDGNFVVTYLYDAWGKNIISDTSADKIGTLNPFRYRGYFYDTETDLYYLQTRYYDPEVGRFLNMDSVDYADPESLDGLNLYAYCNNNPVMYYDPTGHFVFSILISSLIIGTVLGAVSGATKAASTGGSVFAGALIGGLEGLILGGAFGVGGGIGAAAFAAGTTISLTTGLTALVAVTAISFGAGMGIYSLETKLSGGEFNTLDMIRRGFSLSLNAGINFGAGLLFGCKGLFGNSRNTSGLSSIQKIKSKFLNFWGNRYFLLERTYLKFGAIYPFQITIDKILKQ